VRISSILSLAAASLFVVSRVSQAQPVQVTQRNGLISIQCKDAPLSTVFERIEAETGIELTLEDEVKTKKLTANLADLPVSMAIARLLEGTRVNYIVMMDQSDWGRVDKIFLGAGGGGNARAAGPVRGPVVPEEPPEEAFEDAPPEDLQGDVVDPTAQGLEVPPEDMQQSPDEFGTAEDPGAVAPPGSSPLPDFLPPAQSFPKSSFTPGLPRPNQRSQSGQGGTMSGQQPQTQNPDNPQNPNAPPATFPFTDPFGRPIPIPPGMNQQQPQNRQKQQQQQ
jgi:hypothetical protein